ncbi:Ilp8 [Drosophila busckii]|uniref:Ilp8 n=1 Tax=Drosophila busckii TaxID=30019 RepID=A0A0M4EIL9_DROBS|nr:uncharacterized protein LOC108598595 [Drosophila busckii]ALC43738.1 Ilp8 [Drosophila busckii]
MANFFHYKILAAIIFFAWITTFQTNQFINNNSCRIPDPDPFEADLMKNFNRLSYKPCTLLQPLTYVEYNEYTESYVLYINESVIETYVKIDLEFAVQPDVSLDCCYMSVIRRNENKIEMEECEGFKSSVELPNKLDGFIVRCRLNGKLIYTNGHATVPERVQLRQRLSNWTAAAGGRARPSVLLIGIDTMSRQNLRRAMPDTHRYMEANNWFEMAGYNKVANHTFPNLLPFLTGLNLTSVLKTCNPYLFAGLDKCNFIWQLYSELGYVTAFGEDDVAINTFNYRKHGFWERPVDYYMRPYLMAAEHWLDKTERADYQQCLGYVHTSEHVYNYALEFTRRYRNDSYFGMFWTNTHSHNAILYQSSAMDKYMVEFLQRLVRQGTMEHSVVILLSDHGVRRGGSNQTRLSWLEDRQPMLFIWLPGYLRQQQPELVDALRKNRNRLTNPFDLYMTLKHLLALSGRSTREMYTSAADCAQCQSLLLPVSPTRRCADVAIADHWCTCGKI